MKVLLGCLLLFFSPFLHGKEYARVAVLICQKFSSVPTHVDNKELVPAFAKYGLRYEEVIWDDLAVDFTQYDAVLVRATWDYIDNRERFLEVMKAIKAAGVPLYNDLATLQWNSKKTYLVELEQRGVAIIPSKIISRATTPTLESTLKSMPADEYVIKPAVSGGATRTFRTKAHDIQHVYTTHYALDEVVLIQPFVKEVVTEGEWSLIFFNGSYSHAVLSKPAHNDFRVQRMHGGTVSEVIPPQAMITSAERVLSMTPGGVPLYARVDFIRQDANFLLMEYEVIEPCLFLKFDSQHAAERLAKALSSRLTHK